MKADKLGVVSDKVSTVTNIKTMTNLSIDYTNLCYMLEFNSEK
jgi:hypothetical protein